MRTGYWYGNRWWRLLTTYCIAGASVTLIPTTTPATDSLSLARIVDFRQPMKVSNEKPIPVCVGLELHRWDTLLVSQGGSAIIILPDGRLLRFDSPVEIVIGDEPDFRQSTLGRLASSLVELIFPTKAPDAKVRLAVRGQVQFDPPSLTVPMLSYPPSGTMLMKIPDRFEWLPIQGADTYTISLYDQQRLVWESNSSSNKCAFPLEIVTLRPGESFVWVVKANFATVSLCSEQSTFELIDHSVREKIVSGLSGIDSLPLNLRVAAMLRINVLQTHNLMVEEIEEVEAVLLKYPDDYGALIAKARLYEAMNRYSDAVACYHEALQY